jgi:hypothetical protein
LEPQRHGTTKENALFAPTSVCAEGALCCDLSKLRAKRLVEKIPRSRRYRLTEGYRICVLYLKLFHKLYAPVTAASIAPVPPDRQVPMEKTSALDKLYLAVDKALDSLVDAVGLRVAA